MSLRKEGTMCCERTECEQHPVCDILGDDTDARMIALDERLDEDDSLKIPEDCPIL
jgi:hypothetical protein